LTPGDLSRCLSQSLERPLLLPSRVAERFCRSAAGSLCLGLRERLAGLEKPLDVELPFANELVGEPGTDGRLAQALHLVGEFSLPLHAEALGELVASRGELLERQPVKTV
jgi:hypothetical protein